MEKHWVFEKLNYGEERIKEIVEAIRYGNQVPAPKGAGKDESTRPREVSGNIIWIRRRILLGNVKEEEYGRIHANRGKVVDGASKLDKIISQSLRWHQVSMS